MAGERCSGSGQPPAERVILDTVMGMDPPGTCAACGKSLTLRGFRIPDHEPKEAKG